jgi:hypothetical protein
MGKSNKTTDIIVCTKYVKGKKVKFTLGQATKVQRGSRGTALLFFNPGAR